MKTISIFAFALLMNTFAYADLATDCSITDSTSCVLNNDAYGVEFLVALPNYSYCGVKFLSDTVPERTALENFAEGLYVTAGPRWDLTSEQSGHVDVNLIYPVGEASLFATYFTVYTRSGQSLNDYVHEKLATIYQPNPTVVLVAIPCVD